MTCVSNEWLNKSRGGTDIGYQNSPVDVLYVDIEPNRLTQEMDCLRERQTDGLTNY